MTAVDGARAAAAPSSTNAMRYREYAIFISGAFLSNVGNWLQNLAVPIVIYDQTGSATWVGFIGFALFFPSVLLAPLGGALADRLPRRTVLLCTQSSAAVFATCIWLAWVTGVRSPWAYAALVGLQAVVTGINIPSWQTFISELVPRDALLSAISINGAQFNAARALGPALGAVVLSQLGAGWAFGLNAASFAAVLLSIAMVRPRPRPREKVFGDVMARYLDGAKVLLSNSLMRNVYFVTILGALLGNASMQLLPVIADERFGMGSGAVGVLAAAFGAGAVVAAFLQVRLNEAWGRAKVIQRSFAAFAVAMIAAATSPHVAGTVAALFFAGWAYLHLAGTCSGAIHLTVTDDYRGRVIGFYLLGWTMSYPLGSLLQGWFAELIGVTWTITIAAVLMLPVAAVLAARPSLLADPA